MAIVFEDALKKNISQKQLLSVYILFGEDGYLKKNYTDRLIKLITEPDDVFNCCKFGADCDLQEVYDAVMQFPFMSDKKYVEICDFDFEHCSKSELDRLCELIAEVPDSAVLVLRFDSLDFDSKKNNKFKRLVDAAEKVNGMAVKLDHRKAPELIKMLCDGAQKRGCKMEPATAKYLIETAGDDINLLRNELEKLCAYSSNNSPITKETVEKVSIKTVEASVYNLSKFILEGNISSALKIIDELFFMRVEPMAMLYSIASPYVDMMRVYTAKKHGIKTAETADTFGYKAKAFLLDKAETALRKMDFKKINLSLSALVAADNSLKSFGADPRIVIEQLAVRLSYIAVKGDKVD